MEWSDFVQQVGGNLIQTVTEAKYRAPLELEKLKLQAYGPTGQLYTEGQRTATTQPQTVGGMPSWLLLGGVAIFAIAMLKD